jgi:hypothetical protein
MVDFMNKAPKKIWVSDMGGWFENESSHDIPYIRADLVDGLVEALNEMLAYSGIIEERDSDYVTNKARAALKVLEQE